MAYYNIFLTEAILELLAERGILTGEEVLERVKKLKNETRYSSDGGNKIGHVLRLAVG